MKLKVSIMGIRGRPLASLDGNLHLRASIMSISWLYVQLKASIMSISWRALARGWGGNMKLKVSIMRIRGRALAFLAGNMHLRASSMSISWGDLPHGWGWKHEAEGEHDEHQLEGSGPWLGRKHEAEGDHHEAEDEHHGHQGEG